MKKLYMMLFLLFGANGTSGQTGEPCTTCLPQGITFTFQSQINNFQASYPNCTLITGNVKISGANITNLNGLSVLTSIGGYLSVVYNPMLTSLSGLEGLTSVGGTLSIEYNTVLTGLTGLASLTSVGGSGIWINKNPALESLTGLDNLVSVDMGSTGGVVSITENPLLQDLTGLVGLSSIGRDLRVWGNSSMTSLLGLDGVNSIGEELDIASNPSLASVESLAGLTSIGGSIVFYSNDALTTINGLDGVTAIGGSITFGGNTALTDLSGLNNLTTIAGSINFYGNTSLTSLTGLDNILSNSITNLAFTGNSSLSSCAVQSVCDYLISPGGTVNISGNSSGCNTLQEVEAACAVISACENAGHGTMTIYPNPSSDLLFIGSSLPLSGRLSIIDIHGRQLFSERITGLKTIIDISALSAGIYVVHVIGEEGVQFGKFFRK